MESTYINPWWRPDGPYSQRIYSTTAKPVEYRGLLIYNRFECCHDIVKDRVCIGQYAGLNGAKGAVDNFLDGGDEVAVFFGSRMAEFLEVGRKRLVELED